MIKKVAPIFSAIVLLGAQPYDQGYTSRIKEFTTDPQFLTELVDHLPASATIPTPEKFLGYIAGAPDRLTYAKDIHRYMRELERTSPRVRTWVQGVSEEGRETLLVAVSDAANLKKLDRIRQINARLADPRKLSEKDAEALIAEGIPIYWASGAIHSPETGSPEMLMEFAYRLAVEESPFIESIRRNTVVLITPVLEVDGRERMVDTYRWRKANPNRTPIPLVYWGKYVVHDNNRDGISLSLALSRTVTRTFLEYHPQVVHDLHESVPFLYTSTGTGPYNAWLDPIVINEWQRLAYHEVEEMTKRGVPGVWTQGFYDGWGANYMLSVAHNHNAIGRFYETYGNRGADTMERTVPRAQTTRTWFRPNPPLEKVKWSIRNNVNLQQSGLLFAVQYVARHKEDFLRNFYLKSRRACEKAYKEGPAAWVLPSEDPRPVEQAELINLLRLHGVEVHKQAQNGNFIVRMDQPYSRLADMLLDTQYYSVNDPRPYDDTGWTLGAMKNVRTQRVTDAAILKQPMGLVMENIAARGVVVEAAATKFYVIAHNTDNTLASFRFRFKNLQVLVAEEAFDGFPAGSWIVPAEARLQPAAVELGLKLIGVNEMPKVTTHPAAAPRVALVHTWTNTQSEGWVRLALDRLRVPYTYISDQKVRMNPRLRDSFDVILWGPVGGSAQAIVRGFPSYGQPVPWKGDHMDTSPDTSDDIRGGLGLEGVANLQKFVEEGGLFVTIGGNASIPIDFGLVDGVSIQQTRELQVRGSIVNAVVADRKSPIVYGYGDKLPVYFNQTPVFQVSLTGGMGRDDGPAARPSGRGSPTDPDIPQGRPYVAPQPRPQLKPGEEPPTPPDVLEMMRPYMPPEEMRPRVILRFSEEKDLLVSGMLAGGRELANRPAIVQVPRGKGNILMFANNPMWREQTQGSHFLLFNAMLNFDNLGAGRKK